MIDIFGFQNLNPLIEEFLEILLLKAGPDHICALYAIMQVADI